MALIPLKQTVTITPNGAAEDAWGHAVPTPSFTLNCRIQEGAKLIRSSSGQDQVRTSSGRDIVSTAQIYFDKLAAITVSDTINYVDDNGVSRTYLPLAIEVKRGLNGKALLTVVSV